jgi:hypothetical protein
MSQNTRSPDYFASTRLRGRKGSAGKAYHRAKSPAVLPPVYGTDIGNARHVAARPFEACNNAKLRCEWQGTDIVGNGNGQDDVDLLYADLGFTLGQGLGDRDTVHELSLVRQLLGDAEPFHQLHRDDAARAGAPRGDRLGGAQGALKRLGRADCRALALPPRRRSRRQRGRNRRDFPPPCPA